MSTTNASNTHAVNTRSDMSDGTMEYDVEVGSEAETPYVYQQNLMVSPRGLLSRFNDSQNQHSRNEYGSKPNV